MATFCLLKDPDNYKATDWDLLADEEARAQWLDDFSAQFKVTMKAADQQLGTVASERIRDARGQIKKIVKLLKQSPASIPGGVLTVKELCRLREIALTEHELTDPFLLAKQREGKAADKLYSNVVTEIAKLEGSDRWLRLIKGVFAGNLFDVGSTATMSSVDTPTNFMAGLKNVKDRPWFVDDFDAFFEEVEDGAPYKWRKAIVFVDNAGPDFILGLMPLLKELATGGTSIMLAANERPSLNDLSMDETLMCLENLTMVDMDLGMLLNESKFDAVPTGCDLPLLDLANVSDDLNAAAGDADLIIIDGVDRAVQTNFDAEFTVDVLRVAQITNELVAKRVGAELYDCVCKYTPAG